MKTLAIATTLTLSQPISAQSLEQAIASTLASHPQLSGSYHEYMSLLSSYDSSRGAYLPSIDLNAGVGYEVIDDSLLTERSELMTTEASIKLTQLLWDGSATLNNIDRNAAEANSMRYQLISDSENLALQVAKVYLDTLRAEQIFELSKKNLEIHQTIHEGIIKRTRSGVASTADLSQVESRLAKAKTNMLIAQNNLTDTYTQFTSLIGEAPQNLVLPQADMNKIPQQLEDAVRVAKEKHPIIQVANTDVEAAQFQYKQSKGVNLPTFTLEAGHSWEQNTTGTEKEVHETSAVLRMRYNLYNGGGDQDNIKRNAYQLSKSKDFRDNVYRQVEEGLKLSWSALELTLQQKESLARHVDATSDTVTAYEKQYRIGKRTLLDLLNTENELFEARKEYLGAQYTELYAKYRVLNATGTLLNSLLIDTPEEWQQELEY